MITARCHGLDYPTYPAFWFPGRNVENPLIYREPGSMCRLRNILVFGRRDEPDHPRQTEPAPHHDYYTAFRDAVISGAALVSAAQGAKVWPFWKPRGKRGRWLVGLDLTDKRPKWPEQGIRRC
ncbi:hypothetical protein D2N39_04880 [Gemmobacter lutimaris]|uniref:Uncharacterized protein n=1 Tax=Gemmobacter lutimaris TaxID=2306023 RepID=A0A398BTH9_9RHOB|nr:hypothetical protein D2N39_04880 [Gemmobacter lutimaris]